MRASLSRDDRAVVARQFDELERREIGESVLERFTAIAEDLEARHQREAPA